MYDMYNVQDGPYDEGIKANPLNTNEHHMNREEIDPQKYYSATKVSKMGILPWSSVMTFTRALREEQWSKIFNPIVEKKDKSQRFYIKGENILAFIKMAEDGKLK